MLENRDYQLLITGHTDNIGSPGYNQLLSEKRADAIANFLIKQLHVAKEQIKTEGKGEKEPVADNASSEGRAINRRVVFFIESEK